MYHEKFGLGTITLIDKDTVVQVNFKGEEKRLMIKYATFHEPTEKQLSEIAANRETEIDFFDLGKPQESLNDEEIKVLERHFGFTLPEHYRNFLKDFPIDISSFKREYSTANELITERYFRNSVDSIKDVNKYFEAFELKDVIALGDDGCGNYYAIKSNNTDQNVCFINHEGYFDNSLDKYVDLDNINFDRLVKIESKSLKEFGQKIIMESIEFYNSKWSST